MGLTAQPRALPRGKKDGHGVSVSILRIPPRTKPFTLWRIELPSEWQESAKNGSCDEKGLAMRMIRGSPLEHLSGCIARIILYGMETS